jgi:hypothetical protein
MIVKDIDRTILNSFDVKGEKVGESRYETMVLDSEKKHNLFKVLKAYSSYDNEVRYCQGTNFIVAILLSNINSKRYTFWTFVNIMNKNKWRDLFTKNTPKLLRMIDILQNSIKRNLPKLYIHFLSENVNNPFNFSLSRNSQQFFPNFSLQFSLTGYLSNTLSELWTCFSSLRKKSSSSAFSSCFRYNRRSS